MSKRSFLLLSLLLIGVDLLSKFLAQNFRFGTLNTGVSFGLLSGINLVVWVVIDVVLCIGLFVVFCKLNLDKKFDLPLLLIFSGGVGNLISRLIWGGVWDWIDLKCNELFDFFSCPTFNLSDVMIDIGVVLIIFRIMSYEHSRSAKEIVPKGAKN